MNNGRQHAGASQSIGHGAPCMDAAALHQWEAVRPATEPGRSGGPRVYHFRLPPFIEGSLLAREHWSLSSSFSGHVRTGGVSPHLHHLTN